MLESPPIWMFKNLLHLTYWTHYVNKARFEFFPLFTCGFRWYLLKVLRELWSEQSQDLPASVFKMLRSFCIPRNFLITKFTVYDFSQYMTREYNIYRIIYWGYMQSLSCFETFRRLIKFSFHPTWNEAWLLVINMVYTSSLKGFKTT